MTNAPIKIVAEPAADPAICRFTVDQPISPNRTVDCRTAEDAAGAPLLEMLFVIDGVREVMVSGFVITVAKSGAESWQVLGKKIGEAIRLAIEAGEPLIPDSWGAKPPDEDRIFREVEQILATRINPGISAHGGKAELVDVKGTTVYLRLGGGCQGCGAANVTLKQGIEKAIKAQLPEVTRIVDVTDHASGKNPFYKKTRTDGSALS